MEHRVIDTARLILREVTPATYQYVFTSLPTDKQIAFFGDEKVHAKERERLRQGLESYKRSILYFTIIDRSTNLVIGSCGYHTWWIDHRRAELFYILYREEFKRRGLVTEALKEVLSFGFKDMNLHRVEACVSPDNAASLAVMRNFGFTHEGLLREHYNNKGKMEDSMIFSLLQKEYTEQR